MLYHTQILALSIVSYSHMSDGFVDKLFEVIIIPFLMSIYAAVIVSRLQKFNDTKSKVFLGLMKSFETANSSGDMYVQRYMISNFADILLSRFAFDQELSYMNQSEAGKDIRNGIEIISNYVFKTLNVNFNDQYIREYRDGLAIVISKSGITPVIIQQILIPDKIHKESMEKIGKVKPDFWMILKPYRNKN